MLSCLCSTFCFLSNITYGQSIYDSIKIKEPKHYFNTVIFADFYNKPEQAINDSNSFSEFISDRLKTYGIKQNVIGFYTPIATVKKFKHDSVTYSNTHYLLTGHLMSLQPKFEGLATHNLVKVGVGLRIVHNSGKKGVWFIDFSPFVTKDVTFKDDKGYFRMANSLIYSHNFSPRFNLRLGFTKSFLWGNRNYLPYLGLRLGRLDKFHFTMQIPKNIAFNFPINNKAMISLYSKPQGGMFTFSNKDSLYYFNREAKYFYFSRYEILTGLRFDGSIGNNFSYYVALGTSSKNRIAFYSEKANNSNDPSKQYKTYFYFKDFKSTGFLNLGLVFRFGKTKSVFNNRNLYDVMDLNNTIGVGDNNINPGSRIPIEQSIKQSKLNLADIQDLIDANDF
ncbi:MAG: DUF6268 family outer membrane beta-barrel protein [Bacteroidia bacterium]